MRDRRRVRNRIPFGCIRIDDLFLVTRFLRAITIPHTQARGEAQSALDVVEGFATLNRKLVDELR